MEQQQQVIKRLQRIFEIFLRENFSSSSDVYFEKLISHLSEEDNLYVLQAPFALDWVDRCVQMLSEDFSKINPKVTSFMLNLCSLLVRNEWILVTFKERNIMDRVLAIIESNISRFNPSIKLGFVRLLAAVSRYSMGLAYIRQKKCWLYLIALCDRDHTLYVVREARQLLYELIYKYSVKAKDENVVLDILNEIMKPMHENVFKEGSEKITICVDDSNLQQKLSSTLSLLSYLLEQTLESEEKTNIAHLFQVHHNLELTIWKLTEQTQNPQFLTKILQALASLNFATLVQDQWEGGKIDPEKFSRFGLNFYNGMKFCVQRRKLLNFIKLAELNHILWKKLGKRAPSEIQVENERVKFENQLITFQLLPLLFILRTREFMEEELFDNYIMKLFEISCEHTLRICYAFRDIIVPTQNSELAEIASLAYKAIHGILAMQNILEREQAILVFQAMMYGLKEFINMTNAQEDYLKNIGMPTNCSNCSKHWVGMEFVVVIPNVLYASLVGLQTLIKRYRISWKESIESTCVVNMVSVILENPDLSECVAVQALKLVQLSIEHFLSPNMALLVDNLRGSGLVCLGPIIVKRFHDIAWEVRDSALELATSIANISRIKFPAFQHFLVEYGMSPIVLQMAKNDQEPYVRASAYKCLSKMVKISIIWDSELANTDLIQHIFSVLHNESEGLVRKEAIRTLATIYEYRTIPAQHMDTLYSTLVHCVIHDLHWEVKVEALRFWNLEFKKQFTYQGMIDGTFPTVTFSKEHKKIVTLNEKEIHLRILKVFKELSQRGCLGVILKCLKEECDLEVLKEAVCMVNCLLEQLKKYDFESKLANNNQVPLSPSAGSGPSSIAQANNSYMGDGMSDLESDGFVIFPCSRTRSIASPASSTDTADSGLATVPRIKPKSTNLSKEQNAQSDQVIDSILKSQDINLLISSYENQMHLNNGNVKQESLQPPCVDSNLYKTYTSVQLEEFMHVIKTLDLNQVLKNHSEWFLCADSFISLLDDILFSIKREDDDMFADCY